MAPMMDSLLVVVGLLIVAAAAAAMPQGSGCEPLDQEPPSKRQLIKFGRNSSLTFDGFIPITSPDEADKFVALENGRWQSEWQNKSLAGVNLRFDCAYATLHSKNLAYISFSYLAKTGQLDHSICGETESIHLDPSGAYASPSGAPTDFKCLSSDHGPVTKLAIRYIKLIDDFATDLLASATVVASPQL